MQFNRKFVVFHDGKVKSNASLLKKKSKNWENLVGNFWCIRLSFIFIFEKLLKLGKLKFYKVLQIDQNLYSYGIVKALHQIWQKVLNQSGICKNMFYIFEFEFPKLDNNF